MKNKKHEELKAKITAGVAIAVCVAVLGWVATTLLSVGDPTPTDADQWRAIQGLIDLHLQE